MIVSFREHPKAEYVFNVPKDKTKQLSYICDTLDDLVQHEKRIEMIPEGEARFIQMAMHHLVHNHPQKFSLVHETVWHNPHIDKKTSYEMFHQLVLANRFLAAELLVPSSEKDLKHLLMFARRLTYGEANFPQVTSPKKYFDVLSNVLINDVQVSEAELRFIGQMEGLIQQQQLPFIYFLQNYVGALYKQSDLTDFIVFFYRLAEELLLYAMGWDTTTVKGRPMFTLRKGAKKSVVLPKGHISQHFNSYIQYLKRSDSYYAQQVLEDFEVSWLKALIELRHNGISGHGFTAYSHDELETICICQPLEKMQQLLAKYEVIAPHDFLLLLKEAIAAKGRHFFQ